MIRPPKAKQQRKSSNKGFNLIEAAIVLGVVGLVIGGIWVAAAAVQNSRQTNQIVQTVVLLHGNVQKLFYRVASPSIDSTDISESMLKVLAPPGATVKPLGGGLAITDDFGNSYLIISIYRAGSSFLEGLELQTIMPTGQCIAAGPRLAAALKSYLVVPPTSEGGRIDTPGDAAANCGGLGIFFELKF